jgi:hypothetical protein
MPGWGAGHERQCVEPGCILASREDDRGAEAGLTLPFLCGEHDEPSAEATATHGIATKHRTKSGKLR